MQMHTMSGGFTISTLCSLQFAAVNRDNVKDVVSVHRDVWAIVDVALYRGLTVKNFKIYYSFRLLIYLVVHYLDRHKSQTLRPPIYRNYHRKMERIKF